MKPLIRRPMEGRLELIVSALTLSAMAACGTAPGVRAPAEADAYGMPKAAAPALPVALQAPPGERRAFEHHARGVQVYRCAAASGGKSPGWAFVAPQAELYAAASSNVPVGRHGEGPFWQANDGSRVTGQVKARADAPQAGAIPWLLLAATSDGSSGTLAAVTSIQRVQTVGGVVPGDGCEVAADIGKEARVPYTAQYVYYVRD